MKIIFILILCLMTGGVASAAGILLLAKSSVVCVPGNSTGVMDFSVCSNVGITAAVF